MQVLKSNGLGVPQYDLSGPGALYDCQGLEQGRRPEAHTGCGRVTVVTSYGSSTTFASDTHEPLGAFFSGMVECNGVWGDPIEPCADETVCSLCDGDPNVCKLPM
jgi:hypothetical protein